MTELCRPHGLTIGLGKCEFAMPETEFLGHRLSSSSLYPLPKHTSAIRDFPPPTDKPGLQRFLGMINFQRCLDLINFYYIVSSAPQPES